MNNANEVDFFPFAHSVRLFRAMYDSGEDPGEDVAMSNDETSTLPPVAPSNVVGPRKRVRQGQGSREVHCS